MSNPVYGISAFAAVVLVASGSIPNAEHFAACNAEARDAVKSGSAAGGAVAPNTRDRARAEDARRGDAARPDDAQLAGMDVDGAKNPIYQAAYRTCMRRSGF
jgi:hypothetical protein